MTDKILRYYKCANYCALRFADVEHYNDQCKNYKDKIKFFPRRCWNNCMSDTKIYNNFDFEKVHQEKFSCCEKNKENK